jgi:hypothetical protein
VGGFDWSIRETLPEDQHVNLRFGKQVADRGATSAGPIQGNIAWDNNEWKGIDVVV